ncbi:MAG: tRNA (adenosine(37)-N6)-dimethylallyltransferase MiaA [Candidatus Dormibacteria bacterium]
MVGPTAAGKTAVAVELARRTGGEIVSFDSRQVYLGLKVTSSAPTSIELGGVVAHLVAQLDPSEEMTAARYVALVRQAVLTIPDGRQVVITAGTGMYLKAYLEDLDLGGMGAVPALRESLEADARRDLPALARRLTELSPDLAAQTDLSNPARVVRRMELLVAAAFAEDGADAAERGGRHPVKAVKVGLAVPPDVLEGRIAARLEWMLESGWREEVEALLVRRPAPCRQVMTSIGVAEMVAHIRGEMNSTQLRDAVLVRTRQYAKRQRTWFRGDPEVRWLDAGNRTASDIVEQVHEMLS